MNYLETNLAALEQSHPGMRAVLVADFAVGADLSFEMATSGMPTATLAGTYLHSRHDPVREATRRVAANGTTDCTIFLGFGLGYLLQAFIATHTSSARSIIVVIPTGSRFLQALTSRDMAHFLAAENIHFLVEAAPPSIVDILTAMPHATIEIIALRALYEHTRVYFRQIEAELAGWQSRTRINRNTLGRFGTLWVRNLARNLPLLPDAGAMSVLAGQFAGIPSIVLGAGPSLDYILPIATEIADRCIIIAVDTALAALAAHKIQADFAVVIDPQYWNSRHLDRVAIGTTVPICESSTHPRALRLLGRQPLLCDSHFPLGSYIEQHIGSFGALGAGGSVATTAWDLARIIGSRPIYCGGIDLGFPQGQIHCRGSFFEERMHLHSGRLNPAETGIFAYLGEAGSIRLASNANGHTTSDTRMLIYKQWFEAQMRRYPEVRSYNLAPQGVKIEGMPYRAPDTLLSLPRLRATIAARRAVCQPPRPQPADRADRVRRLQQAIANLLQELAAIEALANEGLQATEQLAISSDATTTRSLLARLATIDHRIRAFPNRDIAGFLIFPAYNRILQNNAQPSPQNGIANSRALYRSIAASSALHRYRLANYSFVTPAPISK